MKIKRITRLFSLLCAVTVTASISITAADGAIGSVNSGTYDANSDVIYINNVEELLEFADDCSLDSWSVGKTVLLCTDITLDGDFAPIPYFAGSFDGQGHTISGLNITGSYSPAGLFAYVSDEATISNLKVAGVVTPSGEREAIGGIVGENAGRIIGCEFSGIVSAKTSVGGIAGKNLTYGEIYECHSDGNITGENMTGGIVGENAGSAVSCKSEASVNTAIVDHSLSLDELSIGTVVDLENFSLLNAVNVATDTGGIAGFSSGMLLSCQNSGEVGYEHIGYNVGGIAGRSSGYISNCQNDGKINGRKDIGGIIGQSEPQISIDLSEDKLTRLERQLSELGGLLDKTVNSVSDSSDLVLSRFSNINDHITAATGSLSTLGSKASDWVDDSLGEINRLGSVTADTISRFGDVLDDIESVSSTVSDGFDQLESAIDSLSETAAIGADGLELLGDAADKAQTALNGISDNAEQILDSTDMLAEAFRINDHDKFSQAVDDIIDSLVPITDETVVLGESVESLIELLRSAGWTDDALDSLYRLSDSIGRIGDAINDINTAVGELAGSFDTDWDQLSGGLDSLANAASGISSAVTSFKSASELASAGIDMIKDGIELMLGSITINDEAAARDAASQIAQGFGDFGGALQDMGVSAADALSALLSAPVDTTRLKAALESLKVYSDNAAAAASDTADGFKKLAGCLVLTPPDPVGAVKLTIKGFDTLKASTVEMRSGFESLSTSVGLVSDGFSKLFGAVTVKDEASISSALNDIHRSLSNIAGCIGDIGAAGREFAAVAADMLIFGDSVAASAGEIASAFTGIAEYVRDLAEGVTDLYGSLSVDTELSEQALEQLREGIAGIIDMSGDTEDMLEDIGDAMRRFSDAGESLSGTSGLLADAVGIFEMAAGQFAVAISGASSVTDYIANVEPIQFDSPGKLLEASAGELLAQVSGISEQIDLLVDDLKSAGGNLSDNIIEITAKFGEIADTVKDIFLGSQNVSLDNIVNDTSSESSSGSADGKVDGSRNNGEIFGDLNVGGIVGSMSIEYDLDPEEDLSNQSSLLNRVYETRAVISGCTNDGSVTSKKDCAGGIVGRMDIGYVNGCESYGEVGSESGDYVGGIAGLSSSKIENCYAKCTLSGVSYIGGIVGTGNENLLTGSDCVVSSCYTIVEINSTGQFYGAISGYNLGSYTKNLYVSDSLRGIDRLDMADCAQRVDYDSLMSSGDAPERFESFTLSFWDGDKLLKSIEFNYGDSFGDDVYPEKPYVDGCYTEWSVEHLDNLHFDTKVEAVYTRYTTALPVSATRDDGRSIFFVQGEFNSGDIVNSEPVECGETGAHIADSYLGALGEFFGYLGSGELPSAYIGVEVAEVWQLTLPDSGQHKLRYLAPADIGHIEIRADDGSGIWSVVEYNEEGSYLTFTVDGSAPRVAAISTVAVWWLWIVIAAIPVIGVAAVIIIVKRSKKKRAKLNK